MKLQDMLQKRAGLVDELSKLAEGELTNESRARFDVAEAEIKTLSGDIERLQRAQSIAAETEATPAPQAARAERGDVNVPAFNKTKRGDSETRALAHYFRTNDMSRELRASNDTDMNIGTNADGGYAAPTGHYQNIIAKRTELMLADRLGVTRVPGTGTTINVPVDNGATNGFVLTTEAASFDRDAPGLGQKAMTLAKYTKTLQLSQELLEDEDSRLVAYVEDYVARASALTHNQLLVTEAVASGTSVSLASASAATATDIGAMVYALKGEYVDGAQWVMNRTTEGAYRVLQGSNYLFVNTPNGAVTNFWGYPTNASGFVDDIGATKKWILLGNFSYMLLREPNGMSFLRDPYSGARTGQVNLHYYMRAVYKVSVAEAIKYGTHA